ncbi:TetR/AcrR family transcriptional regulator [Herbaspirillum sp. GCM10030257]|uniref:TetR/AcrR family transcriptional regulator n=1 Tax=Herbaspirillum sp. GCM10030257 TaxID=3273393 RepID=UPI00360FDE0A
MSRQLRWGDATRMDYFEDGRSVILRSALDCMSELGIEGFTVDDVAKRANISRRTLYRYYGSKNELIEAAVSAENQSFFEEMQRSLSDYERDFGAYLEECICFIALYRQRHAGFHHDYLARSVTTAVLPYIVENIKPLWHKVLDEPYRRYVEQHDGTHASLDDVIALISRIGLAYSLIPADKDAIRSHMRSFRHLFGSMR